MKKIKLTRRKYAIVDDEDYEWLSKYKWMASKRGRRYYAARSVKRVIVSMHRELLIPPKGMEIDHINGNSLDNRRSNLRACTHKANLRNTGLYKNSTTGFKGVYLSGIKKPYRAKISFDNHDVSIGHYYTAEEAAKAYNEKAKELFKDYKYFYLNKV